ncbi:MAG: hypothetical protein EAZ81_08330 [Verrucomicrobia bacterium]|nr:MAG: hypothetical protein EAZ81_08330 [Verrucomicrobiota bacterium]
MQNLDQIRAQHALTHAKGLKRAAISKLPGLIINNGLLATAAFAEAGGGGDNKEHLKNAMHAVASYLALRGILSQHVTTPQGMINDLSNAPSAYLLQRATSEALAYLSFLKRFAPNEKSD